MVSSLNIHSQESQAFFTWHPPIEQQQKLTAFISEKCTLLYPDQGPGFSAVWFSSGFPIRPGGRRERYVVHNHLIQTHTECSQGLNWALKAGEQNLESQGDLVANMLDWETDVFCSRMPCVQ